MKLSPTTQYWLGWIGMGLAYMAVDTMVKVLAARLWLVNPILRELRRINGGP